MTIEDQKLVEQCEAGIKTLAGVDEWVRANPQAAGSSGEALLRESNRLARALRKEAATAARKMCVGVFGPSQSGKSYLISALAQDADGLAGSRRSGTNPPISFRTSTRRAARSPRASSRASP